MPRFLKMESINFLLNVLSTLDPAIVVTGIICISVLTVVLLLLITFFPAAAERIVLIIDAIKNPRYPRQKRANRQMTGQAYTSKNERKKG